MMGTHPFGLIKLRHVSCTQNMGQLRVGNTAFQDVTCLYWDHSLLGTVENEGFGLDRSKFSHQRLIYHIPSL